MYFCIVYFWEYAKQTSPFFWLQTFHSTLKNSYLYIFWDIIVVMNLLQIRQN